jgi:hypothetical protein
MKRLMTVAGMCLAAAGLATPAQAQGGVCIEFFDQAEFENYCMQHGKLLKGIETFEESNVPDGAGTKVRLPAPLRGNVPNVDPANGLGFPNGLTEKNLIIQDNIFPGPNPPFPEPSGNPFALYVIGTGPPYNSNSKKVGEDMFLQQIWASLDLIFTDPYHTGIGFDLSRFEGYLLAGWHISVYNMADVEIAKFFVPPPPGPEPTKFFWGVWCDEGIGRINIWDEAGPEPDAIDNIQMWMEPGQPPACPGDCAFPPDKVVNVVDFLALLAQWGGPGSCDINGDGLVNIQDFLLLLALWGPCPAPNNDECVAPEPIDKTDPEGLSIATFDMWGATPSPEPYKCLSEPPVHKDIWYCLTNVTTQTIGVTITTNIPLFIEVNDGCQCPPGPVIACGEGPVGTNQFVLAPGQQALIRLINWFDLPNDQLKGSMFIQNKIIVIEGVNFFEDPGLFEQAVFEAGKFTKAIWDFKPDHLPAGSPGQPVADFLDIFSHPINAPGVWLDAAGTDLWPPEVDNVQFVSNVNPANPFWEPHGGPDGLAYWKAGAPPPNLNNNALTANYFVDSFDIISGPPAGDNHTAIAFALVQLPGFGHEDPIFLISVYDKNNEELGSYTMTAAPGQKLFLGILTKDPTITIQRVDIWDTMGGAEGISFIALYQQLPQVCVNDCGIGNVDEGEACLTDEAIDVINGGCNSVPPVFGTAQCGDTICGIGSTFLVAGVATRDTDWYFVDLPDPDGDGVEELRARLSSEFSGVCYIIDGVGPGGVPCNPVVVGTTGSAINCDPTGDAFACLPAPATYVVFVATADFAGSPCVDGDNDYTVEITCGPCPPGAMPSGAFDADTSAQTLAPASP